MWYYSTASMRGGGGGVDWGHLLPDSKMDDQKKRIENSKKKPFQLD